MKRFLSILLCLVMCVALFAGCTETTNTESNTVNSSLASPVSDDSDIFENDNIDEEFGRELDGSSPSEGIIAEDGEYDSRDDVALYILTYGRLPSNYITKKEAKKLGWSGGGLDKYADGKSIGGDYFGNYEGILPEKKGREYTECDIDTRGKKSRGAKRIIFSNDGLIYYTDDHYESFELLYGEE